MNGFSEKGLDEDNFGGSGDSGPLTAVRAFDAFPKTKPSYTERTHSGGVWTVLLVIASVVLTFTEVRRWWVGETRHTFSVEQGVGHDLQINLDIVVKMQCDDLHVNVQDASGDRIVAGLALTKDPTVWNVWQRKHSAKLGATKDERGNKAGGEYREEDVHDYLGAANKKKQFKGTPRISRRSRADSCRIFGSMHGNKVQGDFHITARGHGYSEFAEHLDHKAFNFSHHINELSFGPYYPTLQNPLDGTFATTDVNFEKFQYYLSVVPTVYTIDAKAFLRSINKYQESPSSGEDGLSQSSLRYTKNTIFTNQYAVTEQTHSIPENTNQVPGLFIKFDIEPIMLLISEEWQSLPSLFIRIVNVVSGVLVAGGWCYQLAEWAAEYRRAGRGRSRSTFGMLNGGYDEKRV